MTRVMGISTPSPWTRVVERSAWSESRCFVADTVWHFTRNGLVFFDTCVFGHDPARSSHTVVWHRALGHLTVPHASRTMVPGRDANPE